MSRESTPIEALARRLSQNGENSTYDRDAEDIARIVTKHWGDEAKTVLQKALAIVERHKAEVQSEESNAEGSKP